MNSRIHPLMGLIPLGEFADRPPKTWVNSRIHLRLGEVNTRIHLGLGMRDGGEFADSPHADTTETR